MPSYQVVLAMPVIEPAKYSETKLMFSSKERTALANVLILRLQNICFGIYNYLSYEL